MTCDFERDDGAYVLGALSVEDRAAFERHLPDCADCARSVRELAGLPGLLARLPVEIVDPDEPPPAVPETLLPSVVRRVRRAQRRRTWLATGLVAAAAAVAVAAVGASTRGGDDVPEAGASPAAGPTTAASELMQPIGAEPISGWVSLTPVGWGTRLDLTCSYADQGEAYQEGPPTYTMYVTHTDGRTEQVASWKGLPGRTMHLAAATAADADDVASVEIRDRDGEPVLQLDS
jgi:putative zinc finger protein